MQVTYQRGTVAEPEGLGQEHVPPQRPLLYIYIYREREREREREIRPGARDAAVTAPARTRGDERQREGEMWQMEREREGIERQRRKG
jgi:hypothetical protein